MSKRQNETEANEEPKKYYISHKCYTPAESTLLCRRDLSKDKWCLFAGSEELYLSPNGKFFLVTTGEEAEPPECKLLTQEEAQKFMDQYPEGILTENYDSVLGTPERG